MIATKRKLATEYKIKAQIKKINEHREERNMENNQQNE